MKTISRVSLISLVLSFGLVFSLYQIHLAHAQTSTDTNPCFSVNQSFYTPSGYRAAYSQIYLSDGTTLVLKNQSTPSILENFIYTAPGSANSSGCSADDILPHISVLSKPASTNINIGTEPWSVQNNAFSGASLKSVSSVNPSAVETYDFLPDTSASAAQTQYKTYVQPNEDAIINAIDQSKGLTFVGTNGTSQVSAFLPMTNCVAFSGTGPKKVVFMKGKSTGSNVQSFLTEVNSTLNILKTIDPYKDYWNQFSFYVDLKSVADASIPQSSLAGVGTYSQYATNPYTNVFTSSCASSGLPEVDVVLITQSSSNWTSAQSVQFGKTIFLNDRGIPPVITGTYNPTGNSGKFGTMAMWLARSLGKSIGGLNTEEIVATTGNLSTNIIYPGPGSTNYSIPSSLVNCSYDPGTDYRGSDGVIYGAASYQGCTYLNNGNGTHPRAYYRPSNKSIMNATPTTMPVSPDGTDNSKFSVISCGYLVAGLLSQTVNETNASAYWPLCKTLDTAGKGDIASLTTPPVVSGIAASGSSNSYSISGTGFSTTGNFIKLTPVSGTSMVSSSSLFANVYSVFDTIVGFFKSFIPRAYGQTAGSYYEIDGVASTGGTTATFSVPSNIPNGTYKVSMSTANSAWTDTSNTITVSGNGAGDTTTAISAPSSGSSVKTMSAIATRSCPSGTVLSSDNSACFKEGSTSSTAASTVPASVQYYCPSGENLVYYPNYGYPGNEACTGSYVAGFMQPLTNYYCPSGVSPTVSGSSHVCSVPASSSFTAASVATPSVSYSCPSTFTLSGTTCTAPASATPVPTSGGTTGGISYTVTPSVGAGGSISPSSVVSVANGSSQKFTVTPASGYQVKSVVVDGIAVGSADMGTLTSPSTYTFYANSTNDVWISPGLSSYTFNGGSANRTISATFSQAPVTVGVSSSTTATSSTGVSIILSGVPTSVSSGQSTTITWSSHNASSCSVTDNGSAWQTGTSGSVSSGALTAPAIFSVTCTAADGSTATKSVPIGVPNPSTVVTTSTSTATTTGSTSSTPIATISASPTSVLSGQSTTITWSSDASYCSIYGNGFSLSPGLFNTSPSGSYTTSIVATTTFMAYCTSSSSGLAVKAYVTVGSTNSSAPTSTTPVSTTPITIGATLTYTCSSGTLSGTKCIASSTVTKSPATSYKCPTGYTLNSSTKICTPNTTSGTISATATYSCSTGTLSGTKCLAPSTATKSPATSYKCPTGYTLNSAKSCTKRGSTTVFATATYTCFSGYTLNTNDNLCHSNATVTTSAATTYSCPADYTLNSSTRKCTSNTAPITVGATATYTCSSGYTLNTTDNLCHSNATVTTSATATYICPAGYTLNSSTKKCTSNTTSMTDSSASSTASVWDAITEWFWGWFR